MKRGSEVFLLAAGLFTVLATGVLLNSCSSGGNSTPLSSIALYVTDDLAGYKQVITTINKIDLKHTGSGASCNVFTGPLTLDIANLTGVMQLIDTASCPAVPYNRIHLEFGRNVALMDQADTSSCLFTSFLDQGNQPNTLTCGTSTCTLDINGAVNLLVTQQNKLALDFDLKSFKVANFGNPQTCSVTMKVSPLHAGEIEARKNPEAFTGLVSSLSSSDQTFTLTRGSTSFTVLYSGISTSLQPGLDTLLQRAQDDGLRVRVVASAIDLANSAITASSLYAKLEGTIAAGGLDAANHLFTVIYKSGKSMVVDYGSAIVEGTLAEGAWVEIKLTGFDGIHFHAGKIEVLPSGTTTED